MRRRTAVALAVIAPCVLAAAQTASADRGLFGARAVTLDASLSTMHMLRDDPELAGRTTYQVLASLPTVESTVRMYDVRPVVNFVFGQTVQLTESIVVKFARGRNLVQANLGPGRTLGVVPNGFGIAQGGILSFSTDF